MSGAVLSDDGSEESAFDDEVEFCGARVDVRGVEAAGAKESDCDGSALSDEGGEGSVIGANNLSTFSLCDASGAGVVCEVEDEIRVLEESEAVDSVRSEDELLEECEAACAGGCARYGGVGGSTSV